MENRTNQIIRSELQAIALLHEDLSKRYRTLSDLLSGLASSTAEQLSQDEADWTFPENNYATLVTWLTNDPWAKSHKAKRLNESWAVYAVRLSKFIGWSVDPHALRRCFQRKKTV